MKNGGKWLGKDNKEICQEQAGRGKKEDEDDICFLLGEELSKWKEAKKIGYEE